MNIEEIRTVFFNGTALYSQHALKEMEGEEFGRIVDQEIEEALRSGEIIREYPEDTPYPSCLVFGFSNASRPIHIVCAYDKEERMVVIVTAYQPDPELWIEFRTRRKP